MLYSKLLVIGDSLSCPSRSPTTWVTWAWAYARAVKDYLLLPVVYGYSGGTSFEIGMEAGQILERHRNHIKEVVFQFGTNDAKDEVNTSVGVFEQYVQMMKDWSFGYRAYFLSIPPHIGFGTDGYTKSIKGRIELYNKSIWQVFGRNTIDLSSVNQPEDYVDGIHYSSEGSSKVGQIVMERIFAERTLE